MTNPGLQARIGSVVSLRQRQIASSVLRRALGPWWKHIGFRHIDRASLAALSTRRTCEPELKLLPSFLTEPGVAFDVGANRGEYTYVLEKIVGSANTYAIEPLPQLSSQLERLFPKAHVLKLALSDAVGALRLKTPVINGSALWTRSTLEHFVEEGETGAVFEQVAVLPLDLLCQRMHVREVRFIKIDVEGHEMRVLRGAVNILKTCHPLLLIEVEQRHHPEPIAQVFSWIEELGYQGSFFDTKMGSMRPIAHFSVDKHQQARDIGGTSYVNNFFFNKRTA